ncbi:uncharacterized protein LOC120468255 isoform X1 [Pimephales promelas]|uniref:uncharacterized protein LOC120468255 isoform X1 n=1 Tax=Pimephales promelas TaxID=90988 RepID=UPI00195593BB|nr:uncharacterized protein LOC120468255 isoform X1 [Pimephales promelas]
MQETLLLNGNVTEEGTDVMVSKSAMVSFTNKAVDLLEGSNWPNKPPRPMPRTRTSPRQIIYADQRVLSSSPYTAATEGRTVLPRDQDDSPQPMRALSVDSRGDLLHSHSVSHKEIDYLTDNLGDLRLPGSATLLTSSHPFFSYEPTQSQHKLAHQEDAIYPQPGIRHRDRPRGYYNTDHRGHYYMSTDQRDRNQYPAAVQFMPQDYSQETAATYGTYKDHSLNCKPVSYFPSTEPYGYQQPYHGIPATSPVYQDERLSPRVTLAHHAHERHSNSYGQSAPNPTDKSSFLTQRQYADYAQPETYQSYHPVRPPFLPYPHVEPTYRGPIPTISDFCSEDPREFA